MVTLHTDFGDLKGIRNSELGVDAFRGIPYAKTVKRMEKSVLIDPWTDSRDAIAYGPKCLQQLNGANYTTSEDCLFLDILKPDRDASSPLLPVVVYVHGGGFTSGYVSPRSQDFFAKEYVTKGIVLVTIQYRLGLFGFLSLGCSPSAVFPCNLGLWDQATAFQFIEKTIHSFGGDKNRMTLWGHSAGSISASIHSTSEETSKYFNNYLEMSGSSNGLGFVTKITKPAEVTKALLTALGCKDQAKYVECFKSLDATTITAATPALLLPDVGDQILVNNQKFNKKQNVMLGLASLESMYFVLKKLSPTKIEYLTLTQGMAAINAALNINLQDPEPLYQLTQKFNITPAEATIRLISAIQFDGWVGKEIAERLQAGSEVYVYHHDYFNPTLYKEPLSFAQSFHTSILPYTINEFFDSHTFEINEQDLKVRKFYVDSIVSFIKTGNPSTSFTFPQTDAEMLHVKVNLEPEVKKGFVTIQMQIAKIAMEMLQQMLTGG